MLQIPVCFSFTVFLVLLLLCGFVLANSSFRCCQSSKLGALGGSFTSRMQLSSFGSSQAQIMTEHFKCQILFEACSPDPPVREWGVRQEKEVNQWCAIMKVISVEDPSSHWTASVSVLFYLRVTGASFICQLPSAISLGLFPRSLKFSVLSAYRMGEKSHSGS